MHFLRNFSPNILWGISCAILAYMLSLPNNAFSYYLIIPVLLCYVFPKKTTEIALFFTIFFGLFLIDNFYSVHSFLLNENNPQYLFYGKSDFFNWSGLTLNFLEVFGFITFLIIFIILFKLHSFFFRKGSFASSVILPMFIMGLIWLSQIGNVFQNKLTYIFSLSMLIMGRQSFYIFNYILFFNKLPKNREEFSLMIQPFWFLQFEIPENPRVQKSRDREEFNNNIYETCSLFLSILLFKFLLGIYATFFNYLATGSFGLFFDGSDIISQHCIEAFRNWRNESPLWLLTTLISYTVTYLISSFFIWGRLMIGVARLCGFYLPDYIREPWKSSSFADFFSRTMYYYNIIIINHFFYPALEFTRRFNLSKEVRLFISLNWALVFGGFFARFLKDLHKVYKLGFEGAIWSTARLALPYMIVLSLVITISLYFRNKKKIEEKTNLFKLGLYFFFYSLIASLNFSHLFGGFKDFFWFYVKIFSFGFIN